LRPHDRHSAHVLQTYRLACRAVNRSIGFSSSPAFDLIERTMTVLTWYSSSTPFSFAKENYVSLQRKRRSVSLVLLTLPNVQPASSSYARQPLKEYRALASIPTNFARISAVTACVSLSGALAKPITSDLHGFTARKSPRSMRRERDTAVQPPRGAHCRTPTLQTFCQDEPDVLLTNTNSTPTHRERDTAVQPPTEAHCKTPTLPTRRQNEPDVLPTDANSTPMHREKDTAVQPPMEVHCRTSTHPTLASALANAPPTAHASSTALSPTKADADGKP
jgi:hypothetical protein